VAKANCRSCDRPRKSLMTLSWSLLFFLPPFHSTFSSSFSHLCACLFLIPITSLSCCFFQQLDKFPRERHLSATGAALLGPESGGGPPQQNPSQRLSFPPGGLLPVAPVQPHLPGLGGPGHAAGAHLAPDDGRHGPRPPEAGSGSPGRCRVSGQHGY